MTLACCCMILVSRLSLSLSLSLLLLPLLLVLPSQQPGVVATKDMHRLYDDLLFSYNRLARPVPSNEDMVKVKMRLRLSQLIDVVRTHSFLSDGLAALTSELIWCRGQVSLVPWSGLIWCRGQVSFGAVVRSHWCRGQVSSAFFFLSRILETNLRFSVIWWRIF